jgi:hypothetical protein
MLMLARRAAHFAKLWSAVATEPPLGREGDGKYATIEQASQVAWHHTSTALQSAPHETGRFSKTFAGNERAKGLTPHRTPQPHLVTAAYACRYPWLTVVETMLIRIPPRRRLRR